MSTRIQSWLAGGALLSLLSLTLGVYWSGLNGPLLLDDIPNLKPLAYIGPIDTWPEFFRFILSHSRAYPVRPLAFASFLINDNGWPLYVAGHKYTNVLIHLLNGALVFWLSLLLARLMRRSESTALTVAIVTTALWLLAPLQVSTVLYVIQRMTELSATFVLAGLVTYCHGRLGVNERPVSAFVEMTGGVVVFGILGFLCKENAILLPLYILVLERTLIAPNWPIQNSTISLRHRLWKWIVLIVPTVMAFGAILSRGIVGGYDNRPYSAFERIASQPRILFDYIQNLLIPTRQGMGVAHDDYLLSTGLLSPPTTLLAIILLSALIVLAFYLSRKSASVPAFAILWFLAGHILESSVIALEPYFEHRNYLPSFGLYFALAYIVWTMRLSVQPFLKAGLIVYVGFFTFLTHQNVDIWSNKLKIGETWAQDHPASVRAQQIRADIWSRLGRTERARSLVDEVAQRRPDTMAPLIQGILLTCRTAPGDIRSELASARSKIKDAHFDAAVAPTLITLKDIHKTQCPALTGNDLRSLIELILDNRSTTSKRRAVSDLLYVQAALLADEGRLQAAAEHLYSAFNNQPSYAIGFASVEFLHSVGAHGEALKVLDDMKSIELPLFSPDRFRQNELHRWRDRLLSNLDHD